MIAQNKISGSFFLDCHIYKDGEATISLNKNSQVSLVVDKDKKENYFFYYTESELQQKIESAVAEHDQATQDTLQGYMDNEQQLLEQIEELKAKVPQPIEITRELAEEIERYKKTNIEWEFHIFRDYFDKEKNITSLTNGFQLLHLVKNGYTVKPEPTLQNKIETILRALEYDFEGVESAAKEIVIVLKHEGLIKDEKS